MADRTQQTAQNLTNALISALDSSGMNKPTRTQVREKAVQLALAFNHSGGIDSIVEVALQSITTTMLRGRSLLKPDKTHDAQWVTRVANQSWVYSKAYLDHLQSSHHWSLRMRQSIRDVSMEILGLLKNPRAPDSWDRRGLVIGQVQSGKTANYLALITAAADAGYKLIVIIAGVTNVLRSQTQQRIDVGFIGRDSRTKRRIGVGRSDGFPCPATLTTVDNDFSKQVADQSGWSLRDFNKPCVLVIKKNVTVLKNLHDWLKTMNTRRTARIKQVPLLLIDDEADHASINTSKEENNPTRTNRLIRQILRLFEQSSFVGYTATPFANIFINPDAYDKNVREDLFPRDFIYCLVAPTSYFGPSKLFLNDEDQHQAAIPIEDCEVILPVKHKNDHKLSQLPPSLCRAIDEFILIKAIRNLRGQESKHCSMMVNVSRFVRVQGTVRDLVSHHVCRLKGAIQSNYALPQKDAARNLYMARLQDAYQRAFCSKEFPWSEVKSRLHEAAVGIRVFLINSRSEDQLDYEKYGSGLSAIAVGGLSLSRGLTLEGLCVSYVYRNTRMYDTLMQMGRWFGYRQGYEDLCRVHLSADAIGWYEYVAEASRDLIEQVGRMQELGRTPKNFGLYVLDHPDRLLITSRPKMISGQTVELRANFAGQLKEFAVLPTDKETHRYNEKCIRDHWNRRPLKAAKHPQRGSTKGWFVRDVDGQDAASFLNDFKTHDDLKPLKHLTLDYLNRIAGQFPNWDVLLISLEGEGQRNPLKLGVQRRTFTLDQPAASAKLPNYRVASRGDEALGLTLKQWQNAVQRAKREHNRNEPIDADFRQVRNKPLLMVHVLAGTDGTKLEHQRMPTIGVSFPGGDYQSSAKVVVANAVWAKAQRQLGPGSFDENEVDQEDK